jgi:hypothetical protein
MSQVVMMLEPELVWLNVLLQPTSLPPHHKPLEDLTFQILDDFGPFFLREMECSKVVVWHCMVCVSGCLRVEEIMFCPVCMNTAQAAFSAAKQLPALSALLQQLSEQRRQQHR